ncbi:DUF29 domain-containing protein [Nodosilinea nodulosa]|uniref:DUF29 domain-containing protein n=1 Tax=Nodosilinea nodulosa TaxID=416001 RepID=UPI00030CFB3A
MATPSLYDSDFYAWTVEQAELLGHRHWNKLDLPNLSEEIESLGRQQRQELRSRLSMLLGHLLKWQHQPQCRSRSWLATARIQRREALRLLKESPSLKSALEEILADAYANGRDLAIAATDLPDRTFPPPLRLYPQ